MSILKNLPLTVRFISGAAAVNNEKGSTHKYVLKMAAPEIEKSRKIGINKLTRLDFLKIQWYMATTLYLGELLSGLRPEKLSLQEKKSLIYLGALMAVTDLMVDDFQLGKERISRLMTSEEERKRDDLSAIERILLIYYQQLMTVVGENQKKIIHDFSLLEPQIDSGKQISDTLTEEEVMEQTRKKGGTALLLVASLLFDITGKNKSAFYQLGSFIQFLNDSQDLPRDIRNSVLTFVHFQESYEELSGILNKEFQKTARVFYESEFPEENVYRLLFYFHAMLTGILFKLDRYAGLTNGVIDTEKIKNTDKSFFRVPMFSAGSIAFCLPKIIGYRNNLRN